MIYEKKTSTIDEHIQQLRDRGLSIKDEALAMHYLSHVSYCRIESIN